MQIYMIFQSKRSVESPLIKLLLSSPSLLLLLLLFIIIIYFFIVTIIISIALTLTKTLNELVKNCKKNMRQVVVLNKTYLLINLVSLS